MQLQRRMHRDIWQLTQGLLIRLCFLGACVTWLH